MITIALRKTPQACFLLTLTSNSGSKGGFAARFISTKVKQSRKFVNRKTKQTHNETRVTKSRARAFKLASLGHYFVDAKSASDSLYKQSAFVLFCINIQIFESK